ncbi:MAG: AAA family ATPase [Nitrososphaerales archaeon]
MFSERFRPKQLAALIGNEESRLALLKWLKNWTLDSKAVLLTGPPGVGKSTSVYSVAEELGYTVIEYNASDVRTKSRLTTSLGPSMQNSTIFGGEKLLVFLDEIDGLSGRSDHAGTEFVLDYVQNAKVPVAMAANTQDDQKLKKIEQKSQVLRFSPVDEGLIFIYLKSIAERLEIEVPKEILRQIARNSRGDVRYALNLLQTLKGRAISSFQTDKQFFSDAQALDAIFSSDSLDQALQRMRAFDSPPFDKVRSTFDSVVASKTMSHEEKAAALDLISKADMLLQQINRNQNWRLLRYLDKYLCLALISRKLKNTDSSIPWNLKLSIWNDGRVIKEITSDLAPLFHVGRSDFANYYLPYLAFFLKSRQKDLDRFVSLRSYGDSEKRVLLKESKSNL